MEPRAPEHGATSPDRRKQAVIALAVVAAIVLAGLLHLTGLVGPGG